MRIPTRVTYFGRAPVVYNVTRVEGEKVWVKIERPDNNWMKEWCDTLSYFNGLTENEALVEWVDDELSVGEGL